MHVRSGTASDAEAIRALLDGAGLPTSDLAEPANLQFWVAEESGRVVGAVGLERYGQAGLLRSLVVDTAHRNGGIGRALVGELERNARRERIAILVLLTQTAEPFFGRLGYAAVDRQYAPDDVQRSAEFRSICPASAVCMMKTLERGE